jgi:hypothetical protein
MRPAAVAETKMTGGQLERFTGDDRGTVVQ